MSGLIPQSFIDDLLVRTDIVEFIDAYVPLKKMGHAFVACCPFHHEKTPSFNVIATKQFYHCFGCGASGNVISFVMNYLNQPFLDAIETLASRLGLHVPKKQGGQQQKSLSLYQVLNEVSHYYQNTLYASESPGRQYLSHRGLSDEVIKHFEVGYALASWHALEHQFKQHRQELISTGMLVEKEDKKTYDRYRHRVMFPIHDRRGHIIGFGGRVIDASQKPKYLNSPETVIFQKNRELYGLYQCLKHQKNVESILVVEGYLDVISLAQFGVSNAVATLGTSTSHYHIQLLAKYTQHVIFCFDGDLAGQQAAWRALESALPYLNTGLNVEFMFLPQGHDPDSLIREEGQTCFLERLKKATSLHQYFLKTLSSHLDVSSVVGKNQFVNAVKPYVLKIEDGPYKQLLLDEVARISHIETHRLLQLFANHEKPTQTVQSFRRSPIRLAVALLIQNPDIYMACKDRINSDLLEGKEQEVLKTLLQQVSLSPNANTATLLEQWRNTPMFETLTKLAAWNHQVPQQALLNEFIDIICFLQKRQIENKINSYIIKSRNEGLTLSDQLALQEMLKQRHQSMADKK